MEELHLRRTAGSVKCQWWVLFVSEEPKPMVSCKAGQLSSLSQGSEIGEVKCSQKMVQ